MTLEVDETLRLTNTHNNVTTWVKQKMKCGWQSKFHALQDFNLKIFFTALQSVHHSMISRQFYAANFGYQCYLLLFN